MPKSKTASKVAQRKAARNVTPAKTGVIATIMTMLSKAKQKKAPVTAQQIVDQLTKSFPDRQPAGMAITVRAQLSRLPSEKDFAITRVREGKFVKYAAA